MIRLGRRGSLVALAAIAVAPIVVNELVPPPVGWRPASGDALELAYLRDRIAAGIGDDVARKRNEAELRSWLSGPPARRDLLERLVASAEPQDRTLARVVLAVAPGFAHEVYSHQRGHADPSVRFQARLYLDGPPRDVLGDAPAASIPTKELIERAAPFSAGYFTSDDTFDARVLDLGDGARPVLVRRWSADGRGETFVFSPRGEMVAAAKHSGEGALRWIEVDGPAALVSVDVGFATRATLLRWIGGKLVEKDVFYGPARSKSPKAPLTSVGRL